MKFCLYSKNISLLPFAICHLLTLAELGECHCGCRGPYLVNELQAHSCHYQRRKVISCINTAARYVTWPGNFKMCKISINQENIPTGQRIFSWGSWWDIPTILVWEHHVAVLLFDLEDEQYTKIHKNLGFPMVYVTVSQMPCMKFYSMITQLKWYKAFNCWALSSWLLLNGNFASPWGLNDVYKSNHKSFWHEEDRKRARWK